MTLFIMSGIPGSGKSTLAKQLSEEWSIPIISSDDIRKGVLIEFGITDVDHPDDIKDHDRKAEIVHKVESKTWGSLRYYLENKLQTEDAVILDTTAAKISYIREWISFAERYGHRPKIVMMNNSLLQCMEWNKSRTRVVPNHVMEGMYEAWIETKVIVKMTPELNRFLIMSSDAMHVNPFREHEYGEK